MRRVDHARPYRCPCRSCRLSAAVDAAVGIAGLVIAAIVVIGMAVAILIPLFLLSPPVHPL